MSATDVAGQQSGSGTAYEVVVEVRLREGIADPEGATIGRALPTLGASNVGRVRVGKSIRLEVVATDEAAARSQVEDLCRRFLTNPVIEDASITVEGPAGGAA